jgi:hypothetical protein
MGTTGDDRLPVARLRPRDGNDQLVILRGRARDGARAAGRFAAITSKLVAMIVLCGAGVFLVGSVGSHSRRSYSYDLDRQLESLQLRTDNLLRMNESLRQMHQFQLPKPLPLPKLEPVRTQNASPSLGEPAKPKPRSSQKLKSE